MGQAPPSKPSSQPEAPSRPYDGRRQRGKLRPLQKRGEPRVLMSLILRSDWQKVLIRAKLFPHEVSQPVSLELYDLPLRVLPLHLVVALDPPSAVVTLFLKLDGSAATVPVRMMDQPNKGTRSLKRSFRALRKYSRLGSGGARSPPGLFRDSRRSSGRSSNVPEHPPNPPEEGAPANQSLLDHRSMSTSFGRRALSLVWRPYRQLDASIDAGGDSSSIYGDDNLDPFTGQAELPASFMEQSLSSSSMASSSRQSSSVYLWNGGDSNTGLLEQLPPKGVILQLSPSGGISPFPIGSQETDSTSETFSNGGTAAGLWGISWDLSPLWQSMANGAGSPDNSLLAIHVATLYQASPAVLGQLLEAHPMGAVSSVLGMLPIHIVSAGWILDPWVAPPPPPPPATKSGSQNQPMLQPYHHHHERHPSRLKDSLLVLRQALPESVKIRSGNHSMTPREYISEAMEECTQKQECLALLEPGDFGEDGAVEVISSMGPLDHLKDLASTHPSLLFVDSFDASREVPWEIHCSSSSSSILGSPKRTASISSLLIAQDWEAALALAEDDPKLAQEWFHGVDDRLDPTIDDVEYDDGTDEDAKQCIVWKRLALHLACCYRAPVGLVDVLLKAYPQAATSLDPNGGFLPLHLACQHKSSYRVVKSLLVHAPTTTKSVCNRGRNPLHYAVTAKAHYAIVELLLEVDPAAALAADEENQTPLDLAKQVYGKKNVIVRLLEMVTLVLEKPVVSSSAPPSRKKRRDKAKDAACYI
ncbi:Ankyrin Repeat [Seminavis robusta]|uniref:Ankyrin Repeat n=1 Tax=Seminavis robusta TaxID=568900 RepID=A0A9N8DFF1_9STRA|nr:Ankyrin Repeat [Seminavis robusta]|eukprot:Sro67_g037430.1 Ankyrin Repeat (757) ;mRNA; f:11967-14337